MNDVAAFWEVPGFWHMVAVLLLIAAAATLCIAFGPTEAPYEEAGHDTDAADVVVKTEWGISLTEWNALTDQDRAYYRLHVTQAKTGGLP